MEPRLIVARALQQFDRGKLILVPDTWTYLNIFALKFTHLIRLMGGKLSLLAPSGFFHWFMDGDGSRSGQRERQKQR
jgi:hypothetical protein